MLNITSSAELSGVCASVGLIQNLGALKALTTVGIIEGHMKLHIKNLTLGAGAKEEEAPLLQQKLEEILLALIIKPPGIYLVLFQVFVNPLLK